MNTADRGKLIKSCHTTTQAMYSALFIYNEMLVLDRSHGGVREMPSLPPSRGAVQDGGGGGGRTDGRRELEATWLTGAETRKRGRATDGRAVLVGGGLAHLSYYSSSSAAVCRSTLSAR